MPIGVQLVVKSQRTNPNECHNRAPIKENCGWAVLRRTAHSQVVYLAQRAIALLSIIVVIGGTLPAVSLVELTHELHLRTDSRVITTVV